MILNLLVLADSVDGFSATWALVVTFVNQVAANGCDVDSYSYFLGWTAYPQLCRQQAEATTEVCKNYVTHCHSDTDTMTLTLTLSVAVTMSLTSNTYSYSIDM